ncbi:MAG: hypothetical protein R6V85_09455 [Polyangia bacterium]
MGVQREQDGGAVMVISVFVALFMVGLFYHLLGVGLAALEQQIVQDGADAVAFSNATAKARGMNLLALINLVMAAALSVMVALRTLQAILSVAIAAVGVACIVTQGAACGAMAPLGQALNKITDIADDVEPRIQDILDGLEEASDVINEVTPLLAEAEAVYISTRETYDPVEVGFAWPVTDELPTKKGSFDELCAKAGENVVVMTTFFLPGGLPEMAQDTVGELVGGMAGTFSEFFCGDSDSPPPDSMTREVSHPLNEHYECDDGAARPDEASGRCYSAQCEQCSEWGCAFCLGAQSDDDYVRGLWGWRRDRWVEWVDAVGGTHVETLGSGEEGSSWLEDDPCEGQGGCAGETICESETREDADGSYPEGAEIVTRTVYLELHGCLVEEEIEMEVQGEPLDSDEWARPRALDEDLLPEGLRVRGFVLAGTDHEQRRRGVAIAAGAGPGDVLPGRLAFAGADFLSGEMDLWHMDWRGRLIRFRLPAGGLDLGSQCGGEFAGECGQVGDKIDGGGEDGLLGSLGAPGLEDFVLH